MQFIDLAHQQTRIKAAVDEKIAAVLSHGKYIMGPEVAQLEETLADYVGAPNAVGCSSGTDALLLALMAYGVGPGDAVITTPFTFISTAEVISLLGATPLFADIDPETYNLDPASLSRTIQSVQSNDSSAAPLNLKGIIAVDLFGLPADYDRIGSIARDHNLFLIEDAAFERGDPAPNEIRRLGVGAQPVQSSAGDGVSHEQPEPVLFFK